MNHKTTAEGTLFMGPDPKAIGGSVVWVRLHAVADIVFSDAKVREVPGVAVVVVRTKYLYSLPQSGDRPPRERPIA